MYYYQVFNQILSSDIPLAGIAPLLETDQSADIQIVLGEVSKSGLTNPKLVKPLSQASDNELWLSIPNIGRVLIINGRCIQIDPIEASDFIALSAFLTDAVLGALLHQKGELVFEGAAVQVKQKGVLLVGSAGAGKSTLAAALQQQGYAVITDNLVCINEHNQAMPGFPVLKIWQDSAKKLAIAFDQLNKVRPQINKYLLPVTSFCSTPQSLQAIYILNSHNQDEFVFQELKGVEKFQPLKNHLYQSQLTEVFVHQKTQLKKVAKLASQLRVIRLTYPNHGFQIEKLTEKLIQNLETNHD